MCLRFSLRKDRNSLQQQGCIQRKNKGLFMLFFTPKITYCVVRFPNSRRCRHFRMISIVKTAANLAVRSMAEVEIFLSFNVFMFEV